MRSPGSFGVELLGNYSPGKSESQGLLTKKLVLMDKLEKIAYNCRKATLLMEKQQLGRLTMGERVELKIHLAGCSVCRIFQQQSITINKLIKDLFNTHGTHGDLDSDFKKSLQEQINKKLLK